MTIPAGKSESSVAAGFCPRGSFATANSEWEPRKPRVLSHFWSGLCRISYANCPLSPRFTMSLTPGTLLPCSVVLVLSISGRICRVRSRPTTCRSNTHISLLFTLSPNTYDHIHEKVRDPVRSPLVKLVRARLSSWVGDDQRIPGVVCFCCSSLFCPLSAAGKRPGEVGERSSLLPTAATKCDQRLLHISCVRLDHGRNHPPALGACRGFSMLLGQIRRRVQGSGVRQGRGTLGRFGVCIAEGLAGVEFRW